jgi:RNA recognition motif-containing protein
MTKRLYVGNLPYTATEDDVRELFAEYGTIDSLTMITDRFTGDFRGFCFLDMEDEPAKAAMAGLDGQDFQGRALRVNEARPRA